MILGLGAIGLGAMGFDEMVPAAAAGEPILCPPDQALCLQAEDVGGIDLNTGTAFLEGNVEGYLTAEQLRFSSQALKAFQGDSGRWERLELDREVRFEQPGRVVQADHGIVEKDELRLFGNVLLIEDDIEIRGETVRIQRSLQRSEITGGPETPVRIQFNAGPSDRDQVTIRARRATVDRRAKTVVLEGSVRVERPQRQWLLEAQHVTLHFGEHRELTKFRAEGNVTLNQPGRRASADSAVSRDNNRTILLIGNARVTQEGQIDLSSQRIEIFTDAEKGMVRTDREDSPLRLTLNLGEKYRYRLTPDALHRLEQGGLPRRVTDKLRPLTGESHPSSDALRKAVAARLTPAESERHLNTILDAAQ